MLKFIKGTNFYDLNINNYQNTFLLFLNCLSPSYKGMLNIWTYNNIVLNIHIWINK